MDLRDAWLEEEPFGARWDHAVAMALERIGERDHRAHVRKQYLWEAARQLGIYRAVHSPRLRALAKELIPQLGESEFVMPRWIGDRGRLEAAFGVLKLNRVPSFANFVLRHRPRVPVLHIVRHPGGFLHSWRTRYLANTDPAAVLRANRERLESVVRANPEWAARAPDFATLDVHASELLYWRYANETIYRAGQRSPNYYFISYELLTRDPLPIMQRLYAACDLPWTPAIVTEIANAARGAREIAGKWRSQLPAEQRDLVEFVLRESPLPLPSDA